MEQFFEDFLRLKREPLSANVYSLYKRCCQDFPSGAESWLRLATNSLTATTEFIGLDCSVRIQLHCQRVMGKVDFTASVWFRTLEGRLDVRDFPIKGNSHTKNCVRDFVNNYLDTVSEKSNEVKASVSDFCLDLADLVDLHFEGALGDEDCEKRDAICEFIQDKIVRKDAAIKALTEKIRSQFKFIFEEDL